VNLIEDEVWESCDIRLDRTSWTSFEPTHLDGCAADLVVPVAVREPQLALRLFKWLGEHAVPMPTFAVLPAEADGELLSAAAEAVDDFALWPVRALELRQRVARILGPAACDPDAVRLQLLEEAGLANLVGRDPAFLEVIGRIPLIARTAGPVLITGETGTGKEVCARAIHHLGRRRSFPFIPVDCGAIPENLVENELFGHVRGAYTDARRDQRGLVAMAEGGTLFLDEVDSLSPAAQAKLLRFLQERTYRPLGAERFQQADVSVVAATNRDLRALVRDGRFREDLYFRLDVMRLHMPALRARRGDIPILARHLVNVLCAENGTPRKTLSAAAVRRLEGHDWPGNVRELLAVLQSAIVFCAGTQILPSHLFPPATSSPSEPAGASFRKARAFAIEIFERSYVVDLLRKHRGNVTRSAQEAQKDRRAFGKLIKKYRINRLEV
jgi:DNA-binding NtrC family response regulator